MPFNSSTKIPKDFQSNFLKNSRNKTNLNIFLAENLLAHDFRKVLFISLNNEIRSYYTSVSAINLNFSAVQEEADTKIVAHVKSCILDVLKKIVVKTVDTDVVALLLSNTSSFQIQHTIAIEVDFDFGRGRKFFDITKIALKINVEQQLAMRHDFIILRTIKKSMVECME